MGIKRNFAPFGIALLVAAIVTAEVDNNDAQTRSWKYFGYYLSKANWILSKGVGATPAQSLPIVVSNPPASSTNFPLSVIPPQGVPTVPPLPPIPSFTISTDTAAFPSFDPPVEDVAQEIAPPPSFPVDTAVEVIPLPSVEPPIAQEIAPPPSAMPPISPEPSPFPIAPPESIAPSIIFLPATTSSPLLTGTASNTVALAQNFPVVIPLPQLPDNPVATGCTCVPAGTCVTTRALGGKINTRIVTQNPGVACAAGQQYCCSQITNEPQITNCGVTNIVAGVTPTADQANFGEFPWSGIILNSLNQYIGGATLIDNLHLLTAAHLVAAYGIGTGLKIRLGEWDVAATYEPAAFVEVAVATIVTHPSYVATTLQNDLAIITLASPVDLLTAPSPQINSACLPAATDDFTSQGCFVAGWGKNSFTGSYQHIIKKVDVPVVADATCQAQLRQTKLGPAWVLDTTSFICAGGVVAKDACTGDGGNGLVCLRNGRFVVAGITAGGVECGQSGVPGLYVNVVSYLPWIAAQIQNTVTTTVAPVGSIDPRRQG